MSGVAFAFLPYRVAQLPHLQMLMFGWMPIGLWALHRFFRSGSRSVLAIFVVAFLLQGLSNLYFLYFFTLPVALVIAFELIRRPPSWGRRVAELAVASVLILLVLAPVGLAYYEVLHGLVQHACASAHRRVRFSTPSTKSATAARTVWCAGSSTP